MAFRNAASLRALLAQGRTPDLHFRMCKKISQLTKALYEQAQLSVQLREELDCAAESAAASRDAGQLLERCEQLERQLSERTQLELTAERMAEQLAVAEADLRLLLEERESEEPALALLRRELEARLRTAELERESLQDRMSEANSALAQAAAAAAAAAAEQAAGRRNLVNQEQKFREQLSQLQELAAAREAESCELRQRAGLLEGELADKTTAMLRTQSELELANKQSELLHQKLRQLEDDIAGFKRYNAQLAGELAERTEADEAQAPAARMSELEAELARVRERADESGARADRLAGDVARLEAELAAARAERDSLDGQLRELLQERREEMEIVQKALEEAQAERESAQRRFEQDYERLRTVNTDREQQLLEDFEWKLREVQQTCKKRLEEKDRAAEQRAAAVRAELQEKLAAAERRVAEAYDTQRALRAANRENERLLAAEKQLKDELARLKGMVEAERGYAASVQRNFDHHVTDSEKKLNTRLVEQRDELTQQWEEKVRAECARLRAELEQLHAENTQLALEAARQERDREHAAKLAALERKLQNATNEVCSLRARAADREAEHDRELENAQTAADRAGVELRRKLDKLDLQWQEQVERLQEQHAQQLERLQEDADRRVLQAEQAWQMQASSTRATLELVKEQLERDAQARLEALEREHQRKLNEQWERLTREREDALQDAQERHYAQLDQLRRELEGAGKDHVIKESELEKALALLKAELTDRTKSVDNLQSNVDLLQGGMQVLNQELKSNNKLLIQSQMEAEQKLRESQQQLQEETQMLLARAEAQHQTRLASLTQAHSLEKNQWHEELRRTEAQMLSSLSNLMIQVEEAQDQPRKRDVEHIQFLEQTVEKLKGRVTFLELELRNREATYNQALGVRPIVGVVNPLQHLCRKGGGPGAGAGVGAGAGAGAGARRREASMPPSPTHPATAQVSRAPRPCSAPP